MTQLTREKIIFTIVIGLTLTIVNYTKGNDWTGYALGWLLAPVGVWISLRVLNIKE